MAESDIKYVPNKLKKKREKNKKGKKKPFENFDWLFKLSAVQPDHHDIFLVHLFTGYSNADRGWGYMLRTSSTRVDTVHRLVNL